MKVMMNKLFFLTKTSLKRKIDTKSFKVANVILLILIVALFNIDSIIKAFGGDFNKLNQVYVVDKTEMMYDYLEKNIDEISKTVGDTKYFKLKKADKDIKKIKKDMKKDDKIILLEIDNELKAKVTSQGYIDPVPYQILYQALNSAKTNAAVSMSNIDPAELAKIMTNIEVERKVLDKDKKSEDESMETIMTTVFPIVILPFFMLTVFLIQMIGMEVNDEKTTRGMEIIISNVSPKTHFFSKVLSGNIFVIGQALLLFIYALIGLLLRNYLGAGSIFTSLGGGMANIFETITKTEFFSKLGYIIPLTLVLMILSFISYSLLAGILASITTNAEDFSQMQTPMVIVLLAGYYLSMMAGVFKGALFIRVLSYIPLISAILSPSLLVLGQIGIMDVIIAILLNIGAIWLLIRYGLRIYKIGILNYSSKDLWKKMFKAMKGNE